MTETLTWNWGSLTIMLPELFLTLSGVLLLVWGAFAGNAVTRTVSWLATGAFAFAIVLMLGVSWQPASVLNGMFKMDNFTAYMKILLLIGMAASCAMSVRYLRQENIARFEYPVLLVFATVGMMLMVSSNNMLSMYMGLELQSLSLYVLAAIRRDHVKSSEAGLKYFVLGALASGMLLFGISLLYGYTGSISFPGIADAIASQATPGMPILAGMVFVLAGIAFKISAAPFHMWTPDVYEGAPTSVTAMFAIAPKIAAIALLIRLLFGPFAAVLDHWQDIIWFLAAASLIVSAFAALNQTNIKRLMAYSSINNIGYALIGLVAGTAEGVASVIVYMSIYMVMTAGVFTIILLMRRNEMAAENISDLSGLSRYHPALAYCMAILMFSMSGIPPLAGFFGKLVVFQSAVAGGFYVLAVLGVLSSVVAAYYYLRIIKVMFFDEPSAPLDITFGTAKKVILALSMIFVVFYIVKPNSLIVASRYAADSLFTPVSTAQAAERVAEERAQPVTEAVIVEDAAEDVDDSREPSDFNE